MASIFKFPWTRKEEPIAQNKPSRAWEDEHFDAAVKSAESSVSIYDNKGITVRGEPAGYDFNQIFKDPQNKIYDIYALATYYKDSDPFVGAAIDNVYVPFSVSKGYRLVGASEATKRKYKEHYDRIGFDRFMKSVFDQYYTYYNVFTYMMPDGALMSLTPNKCRIAEIYINGQPVIEYDTQDILRGKSGETGAQEDFINDLEARITGLPPEIQKNLKSDNPKRWVQLDPDNTYVLQAPKPDWIRYAVPPVTKCLFALARKTLIAEYEKAQLNYGIKGFLEVKVGDRDPDSGMNKPDARHIAQVSSMYNTALTGGKLVVVPYYVSSEFITVDTDTLFDKDKYSGVNQEILSAYGISGVISMGQQEAGSYGQAKLSLDTAALRIEQAQNSFADMMRVINKRLSERIPRISAKNIPVFQFQPVDLTNDGKFADAVYKLWMQGVVSTETLLESNKIDLVQERERRTQENTNGLDKLFVPRQNAYTSNTTGDDDAGGRPVLDDSDRTSDPEKTETGRQPKPSRPEGSEAKA